MPCSNTISGKGFEYATLIAFKEGLESSDNPIDVKLSAAYETALIAFQSLTSSEQIDYMEAGRAAVDVIVPLEPKLKQGDGFSPLVLKIQEDRRGQEGDVRDVVFLRDKMGWEIGVSCKHNHEALKHPRVTRNADFGSDWMGEPCSGDFKNCIDTIMVTVESWIGSKWRDHNEKIDEVYVPILEAFSDEIERLCAIDESIPGKMLSYFFGTKDFYKVIAKDRRPTGRVGITKVVAFNISGTLGQSGFGVRPIRPVRKVKMPTTLYNIDFKAGSKTTLILTFDNGWAVSMRLHSADSEVKVTGLKWDVQLVGEPSGMSSEERTW